MFEADELTDPLNDGTMERVAEGDTDSVLLGVALPERVLLGVALPERALLGVALPERVDDAVTLADGLPVPEALSGGAPLLRDTLGLGSYTG